MPPLPSCARISNRSLISLTGAHATQFLNGIVASGPPAPPRGGFFTAFLHAQGRVLYDAFVYRQPGQQGAEDGYIVEFDSRPSSAPPLMSLLKRYVLRSKVKVKDVSDQWDVWAAWGTDPVPDDRKWRWSRSGAVEPVWDVATWPWGGEQDPFSILDRRAFGMGKRTLVRKGDSPPDAYNHDVVESEAYTSHRIRQGVPEGIVDIPPLQAFPMESNLDIMGALDFRKGCYVGQELTVRTYHTGAVRKRILPVEIRPVSDDNALARISNPPSYLWTPGQVIRAVTLTTPKGTTPRPRSMGKILSSVGNFALALLRLEYVDCVKQGLLRYEMQVDEEGQGTYVSIVPSWPPGWPVPGVNEVE